jgi:hypothetical protein
MSVLGALLPNRLSERRHDQATAIRPAYSDIKGVNMDARTGVPHRNPEKGTADVKQEAE